MEKMACNVVFSSIHSNHLVTLLRRNLLMEYDTTRDLCAVTENLSFEPVGILCYLMIKALFS